MGVKSHSRGMKRREEGDWDLVELGVETFAWRERVEWCAESRGSKGGRKGGGNWLWNEIEKGRSGMKGKKRERESRLALDGS